MADPITGRLLLVDDETRLMVALRDTLSDRGYEVVGVTSGADALAALRQKEFDLLLTDLTMPEMDGIALLRAALAHDPQMVGILMTGQGTISTAVEAMKSGALDYVLKPLKLAALLAVLERALTMRRLRLKNAELEKKVRDRTAELEAANKELEAFSYSVSHDLRAPLRAIRGFSDILEHEHLAEMSAEPQRLLGVVVGGAKRMEQLIEDLLRFSQLGRQPLQKQLVSVSTLVREIVAEMSGEPRDHRAEIEIGDLPDALADPALLRQVFVNLLSNAVKFSRGRERPRVEISSKVQGAERVYFVRDNGAGFNMRHAENLFGVFQRFHPADQFEGTGIGLSIVARIIQRHGGRIWAEAETNKGATFFFTLGS